jgi:L-alanine-DL-glutamate epimerase-like enolase superfamily enzyme
VKVEIELIEARLRAPLVSAAGSSRVRRLLLLRLDDGRGNVGYGEAAPLEYYDGVRIDDVRAALSDCADVLAAADADSDREAVLQQCARAAVLPQATAAVDLALWDLAGRRAGSPVWRLLGAESAPALSVNATIAASDRAGAAAEAASYRAAGFRCLKAKVGIGDDAGRLAAIRAVAGREAAIRIDGNGGWTVPEALATLKALEPVGIECCEEPVSGLEAFAQLRGRLAVPAALDESARLPGALETRYADAVCLKVSGCGGISGVIEAARRARAAGYEVYLASTLDGPLGIAAALHAAVAIAPDRFCGLATLSLFEGRDDPLPARDGLMVAPPGPGLGTGLTGWYARDR